MVICFKCTLQDWILENNPDSCQLGAIYWLLWSTGGTPLYIINTLLIALTNI